MSKIKYDVDVLLTCAEKLTNVSRLVHTLNEKMQQAIAIVPDGWQGDAATQFVTTYMDPLVENMKVYSEMIQTFSNLMTKIAQMYQELTTQAEETYLKI